MPYKTSAPTVTEVNRARGHTEEKIEHEAFGTVEVVRVQGGGGTELFDSALKHHNFLAIKVSKAVSYRSLHRNRIYSGLGDDVVCEFWLSENQWASLVSSVGIANATPITFRSRREGTLKHCDGIKNAETLKDTHIREVKESLAAHTAEAKKLADQIRTLVDSGKANKGQLSELLREAERFAGLAGNMGFAQESMEEAAEKTVAAAQADVEAFAMSTVHKLGLQKLAENGGLAIDHDTPIVSLLGNDNDDTGT